MIITVHVYIEPVPAMHMGTIDDSKSLPLSGGFDSGLNIWGGENIEISLRTWMCGGRMVIHPCSRIAHVFKPFSYAFDGNKEKIIGKNSIRLVSC